MSHPRAWVRRIWRNCVRGARGRQRRLPHVGLRRTEKTRAWPAWGAVPHPGRTCPGGQTVAHGPGMESVSGGASWEALPATGRMSALGGAWTRNVPPSWRLLGGAVVNNSANGRGRVWLRVASGKGARIAANGKWHEGHTAGRGARRWQMADGTRSMEMQAAEMANGRGGNGRGGNGRGANGRGCRWQGCKWQGVRMAWSVNGREERVMSHGGRISVRGREERGR